MITFPGPGQATGHDEVIFCGYVSWVLSLPRDRSLSAKTDYHSEFCDQADQKIQLHRAPGLNCPLCSAGSLNSHGVHRTTCPKRWQISLNTSVLNKTPRDCTEQPYGYGGCTVRVVVRGSHTDNNLFPQRTLHAMAGNKSAHSRTSTLPPRTSTSTGKKAKGKSRGGANPPTAVGSRGINSGPSVYGGAGGTARITHTEYISDLNTTALGAILSFTINASNGATFPWLSRIAQGYELYRFRRLRVDYTPSCSSSTSGVVVGAFEYDANDPAPTNKQQHSAIDGSGRTNIWNTISFHMKPVSNWCFSGSPSSAPGDNRLSDVARFFVATYGTLTSGTPVGDLTISYDVEFSKPEMITAVPSEYLQPTGSSLATMAGTGSSLTGDNLFTMSSPASGKLDLKFNSGGQFMISFGVDGTATSAPPGGNMFTGYGDVYRGDVIVPGVVVGLENASGFVSAGATFYGATVVAVNVAVGDILRMYAAAVMTVMAVRRIRVGAYRFINA